MINNSTKKYRQATQLERKAASPAPPAPISKPQGRMKTGSSTMLSRHPLMVPMLACIAEPSDRTRYAMTTLRMAGTAPQLTVQNIYSRVACMVVSSAPSSTSSGF